MVADMTTIIIFSGCMFWPKYSIKTFYTTSHALSETHHLTLSPFCPPELIPQGHQWKWHHEAEMISPNTTQPTTIYLALQRVLHSHSRELYSHYSALSDTTTGTSLSLMRTAHPTLRSGVIQLPLVCCSVWGVHSSCKWEWSTRCSARESWVVRIQFPWVRVKYPL